MLSLAEIQSLILKSYKKLLLRPFLRAITDYEMIKPNDTISICMSGGKDSFVMALLFKEIYKHQKFNFNINFICMDPGYSIEHLKLIQSNANHLEIPLVIHRSNYFAVIEKLSKENPCYLCARMRRGFLYNMGMSLGSNKIALAHHFDDFIETTLLNIFYGGSFKTMVPKIKSENFKSMELIRPMMYIRESDILKFTKKINLKCLDCACSVSALKVSSKRHEIKTLLATLRQHDSCIDQSIFNSALNVNLDACMGYILNNTKHDFKEIYQTNFNNRNNNDSCVLEDDN